ncbi:hypothetical protein BV898_14470 [Hypsibius exemplaris]|uniref:UPAR/Ly6 domain-containing protein n=1 Tax=Hypsibius exemplaris TaxID=2072580 RepID=A0A9X6NBZ7_HYPEX|nr:hypothetical protein BV898_14470 [Hypsibius exemplaris]
MDLRNLFTTLSASWNGITFLTILTCFFGLSHGESWDYSTTSSSHHSNMVGWGNTTLMPVEPLRCYSCQSEVANSDCVHMNNTDNVPTVVCASTQSFCKVQHFSGNNTFRYVNRSCSDSTCKGGCVQAAGSGDFIFLEMCYYCCGDNLCNTRNAALLRTSWVGLSVLSVVVWFFLSSGNARARL